MQLNGNGDWEIICDECDLTTHYKTNDKCCLYG